MQKIGRYEIIEELGHGAMGVVYRARDSEIGRVVALKVIQTANASPQDIERYKQRFKREAQAAGRLSHPGIVTIHDIAEDVNGRPYLVMEFVEGRPLNLLLGPTARLPLDYLLDIGIQVAQALDFAHKNGVIHRDIKPPNILVTPDGHAKIADFGIARMEGTELTQEGTSLGTPSYMSPEQFRGGKIDGRSDIFSLGAVLYWMFTGTKPFPGETVTITSFQIAFENPVLPSAAKTDLPKDLDDILTRCLAKNPEHRYATCDDLAADLDAVKGGRPLPVRTGAKQDDTENFPLPARKVIPPRPEGSVQVAPADPEAKTRVTMSTAEREAARLAAQKAARAKRRPAVLLTGAGIALAAILAVGLWIRQHPSIEQSKPQPTAPPVAAPPQTLPAASATPTDASNANTAASATPADNPPASSAQENKSAAEPGPVVTPSKKRPRDASTSTASAGPPAHAQSQPGAPASASADAKSAPTVPTPAPQDPGPVVLSKIDVECRFPFKKGTLEVTVDGKAFLQEKLEQKRNVFTAGITEKKDWEKKEIPIPSGERNIHVRLEENGGKHVWENDIVGTISKNPGGKLRIVAKEVAKDSPDKPQLDLVLDPAK